MTFLQIFTLGYHSNYLLAGLAVGLIIAVYSFFRLNKLFNYFNIKEKNSLVCRLFIFGIIFIFCYNIQSTFTILLTYLFFSSVLADIIRIVYEIISKYFNRECISIRKFHRNGIFALIFFILIVSFSIYGMSHIDSTNYSINTNKTNESYSILYISDIHYDTIQDTQLFKNKLQEMNNTKPDIIILGGDIVDERTSKKSMEEVFSLLGGLNSTYGIYYVFGNHDKQPNINDYINGSKPFTNTHLINIIKNSGINILEDNFSCINNDIDLIGRGDSGFEDSIPRKNSSDLVNVNSSKFTILLDHQPVDVKLNSKLGVDLQISGHTHGGQLFPYGFASEIAGKYNYGKYIVGNMTQITSSGFTGWGIPLRNEAKCEYVLININQ